MTAIKCQVTVVVTNLGKIQQGICPQYQNTIYTTVTLVLIWMPFSTAEVAN